MVTEVDFQQTVETAFLKYGASVAQERALPDVRDFLKIGLRQGLYAQYTNKLTHKDKFQKAQKSVAAAMTQSYVHGDVAMYDTLIRAARPWSARYPLEEVQGSYGNPSSPDSHAAARYVEMRSAELSDYIFAGLKKKAVDEWYWNYDDSEQIPSVFPTIGYWNIVNGCTGIAVALATSVPQFNLAEVNKALITLINNPNASFNDIYCAPDFATGGLIINGAEVKESLQAGKGKSVRLRAKLTYNPAEHMIQATELPYSVFTNTVIDQLAELTQDNPNYGIDKVIDHTKKTADIRIYLTKGMNPEKMIKKLYHDTSLENWFSINMVLLDQGRFPKIFGWRQACEAYITHIRQCKRNEINFDLNKDLARLNVVEGLLIAAASIDEVVAIIRSSKDPSEASMKLIARFNFNEEQVKAILAMRLSSLTKIDAIKLEDERAKLIEEIADLRHLLNDATALDAELIKILQTVADKFGDARRTTIIDIDEEKEEVEEAKEEEILIYRYNNQSFQFVKKGEKTKAPKGAATLDPIYTTNFDPLILFTSSGRTYSIKLNTLDYGIVYNYNEFIGTDTVILATNLYNLNHYQYLLSVSKDGFVKKTLTKEYGLTNKKGAVAVKVDPNDTIVDYHLSMSNDDLFWVCSNLNYYNYYSSSEISTTGKNSKGVKAIKLGDNEYVVRSNIHKELNPQYEMTSRAVKGRKII